MGTSKSKIEKLEAKRATSTIVKLINKSHKKSLCIEGIITLGNLGDRSSIPVIGNYLKSDQKVLRYAAALALGKTGNPEAADYLLAEVNTEDKILKACIFLSIGVLGHADSIELLNDKLKDTDKYIRGYAALSLGRMGAYKAVDDLIKLCNKKDEFISGCLVYSLYYLAKSATERIIQALDNENINILAILTETLAKIGDPLAVEPLIRLLNHRDDSIKIKAVEALGDIGSSSAVRALIKVLNSDEKTFWVAESLGKIKDKDAINPLIKLAISKATGWNALKALLEYEDENIDKRLLEELRKLEVAIEKSIDYNVLKRRKKIAVNIAEYLAIRGIQQGFEYLIQELPKAKGSDKDDIIYSLGKTKRPELKSLLYTLWELRGKQCTDHPVLFSLHEIGVKGIEKIAAKGLKKLQTQNDAYHLLEELFQQGNLKTIRYFKSIHLIKTFTDIIDKNEVIKKYIALLEKDVSSDDKINLIKSLFNLNDPSAILPLINILDDEDETVGMYAIKALSKIALGYFEGKIIGSLEE